ncbi:MAG: LuxR C-terminal-related transcriptional regulator, partial [Trebonia sp.]
KVRGEPDRLPRDVPLPTLVEELLGDRIAELAAGPRMALLATALSPDPRRHELIAVVGEDAFEDAVRAGILLLDGSRVRAAHPLLGEVVKGRSRSRVRRTLHGRLAAAATDSERSAVHLALAATGPDYALAATIAAAAKRARARWMLITAAELGEHALALTPVDDPLRLERLLDAAGHNAAIARWGRCAELLRPVLAQLPTAEMRATGMLLLAEATETTTTEALDLFVRAAREAPDGSGLRAQALFRLAVFHAVAQVEQLADAESLAADAVAMAVQAADPATERPSRAILAWIRAMRGLPEPPMGSPGGESAAGQRLGVINSPERTIAVWHMWRGEAEAAKRLLQVARARSEARGEAEAYFVLRLQLCELELRRGDFAAVGELLNEWERERDELPNSDMALARCHALLAAGRGDPEAAQLAAAQAIQAALADGGAEWHRLEALRACGLAALFTGDAAAATQSLRQVWERTRAAGVLNPGTFPVAPDLVAALTATGAIAEAVAVAGQLSAAATMQDHPWAMAAAARASGLVALAQRDHAAAASSLEDAADRFESLDLPFPAARSRHEVGLALRHGRRAHDARRAFEHAAAEFARLDAPGWERRSRDELTRIGGRRPAGSTLTATERRVADLVALGLANKEIAAQLFITVGVVEAHLTRVYRKLGVRSRTQLAGRLAESAKPPPDSG